MMHFKAILSNGNSIFFSSKDADSAMNYGNKQADKKKVQMIAISILTKEEAKTQGLID
jgi:hypothetical protein